MSDATSNFLRGVKELEVAENYLMRDVASESLRRCRLSFTYLARTYLLLSGKPFIGVSNPLSLASILYDLGHEDVFKLVSLAEVESLNDVGRAAEVYITACKKLLRLISQKDPYLDIDKKTYLF